MNLTVKWFLKSPIGILFGVVGGVLTGHFFPALGAQLGGFGSIIVALLKMCIIPIIVTSITLGLATLLSTKMHISLGRILTGFLAVIIVTSSVGVLVAYVAEPGHRLDTSASPTLKAVAISAAQVDRSLDEPLEAALDKGLTKFLIGAVPRNVFDAMAEDRFFQLVIFSFIFGISLAFIPRKLQDRLIPLLEAVKDVFDNIFNSITMILPIAIFLIMAHDIQTVGTDTLLGMMAFVGSAYLAMLVLFIINTFVIMFRTNTSILTGLRYLKDPLFIAVATHSGVAAIPAAITALTRDFKLERKLVGTMVPIGTILGQYGTLIYFSFTAVFVAQFYNISLDFGEYVFIILMAVIAALSAIGASGVLQLPLLAIILEPLGLPLGAVLVLLVAVDAIMDTGMSFMRVHTNCAAVTLIVPKQSKEAA